MKKYMWAAIWTMNIVVFLDLWFNNGEYLVDFMYFITGG